MRIGFLLFIVFAVFGSATAGRPASYAQMSQKEKRSYVERNAREAVSKLTGSNGSVDLTPDAVQLIKREVDDYATRIDATGSTPWKDSLRTVIGRGVPLVPTIRSSFEAEGLPASLGLYVAMVESEFNPCLESPMGARGVFQILPATGKRFGLEPADLCDVTKSAPAAARYFKQLRGDFGTAMPGALLAIRSYNQGEVATKRDLGTVASEEDFWAALAVKPGDEGSRYVARLIAATIVGENPGDFGIGGSALSRE